MSEPQGPAVPGGQTPLWLRRTVVAGLLGGLLLVGFVVMRPFLSAIAWAAILTYVSWPLHLRVLARLRGGLLRQTVMAGSAGHLAARWRQGDCCAAGCARTV